MASSVYQEHLCPKDIELISIKTLMYTATIYLHRDLLSVHWDSYERCVGAADAVTAMTQELSDLDYSYLNPIISVSLSFSIFTLKMGAERPSAQACWKSAAQVYLQVLASRLNPLMMDKANTGLDILTNALKLLGLVFPVAGERASDECLAPEHSFHQFYPCSTRRTQDRIRAGYEVNHACALRPVVAVSLPLSLHLRPSLFSYAHRNITCNPNVGVRSFSPPQPVVSIANYLRFLFLSYANNLQKHELKVYFVNF